MECTRWGKDVLDGWRKYKTAKPNGIIFFKWTLEYFGDSKILFFREAVDSSVDEVENENVDKITNKEYAEVPYTVVERIVYVRKPFLMLCNIF